MKSFLMVLTTVVSLTIGFVLSNTLYNEERRIVMEGDRFFVVDAEKSSKIVMHRELYDPSRMVY